MKKYLHKADLSELCRLMNFSGSSFYAFRLSREVV